MPTRGYKLKIERARHHLDDLNAHTLKWFNGDHHKVIHERHPDGPSNYQVRVEIEDLPTNPFSLLIGDVLHNLRSGLDHLVYALADAHTTTIGSPKDFTDKSQFPIVTDEDRKGTGGCGERFFKKECLRQIGSIDAAAQTIIKGLQPYHRGNDFRSHPLWQLSELSNIDKHRLLHPVVYAFDGMVIRRDELRNIELHGEFSVSQGPVKNNKIVARYGASPIDPKEAMNMDFNPILGIAFSGDTPSVPHQEVVIVLNDILEYINIDVLPSLETFLA